MELFSSIVLLLLVLFIPQTRRAFLFPVYKKISAPLEGRSNFFDSVKGIAIAAVILIHAIYIFELKHPEFERFYIDNINNISRFAVGFFFIASGALLTTGFSRKKLFRIFTPYVIFCLVVGVFQHRSWDLILGGVVRGDLLPPFYFIPVLLQFYFLYPLLARFSQKKYFLAITLFVSYIFYSTPALWSFLGIPTFGPYLYLFSFGLAYRNVLKSDESVQTLSPWLIAILSFLVLQFMFPAHYYNSRYFYAPALFMVLHFTYHKFLFLGKISLLHGLGRISLWVYLVHFSIEEFLMKIISHNALSSVYLYILLISILTVTVSGVLSKAAASIYTKLA